MWATGCSDFFSSVIRSCCIVCRLTYLTWFQPQLRLTKTETIGLNSVCRKSAVRLPISKSFL